MNKDQAKELIKYLSTIIRNGRTKIVPGTDIVMPSRSEVKARISEIYGDANNPLMHEWDNSNTVRLFIIAYRLRRGKEYHTTEIPRKENELSSSDWRCIENIFNRFDFGVSTFVVPEYRPTQEDLKLTAVAI